MVRTDGSYLTARDPRIHVGIGDLQRVPRVVVRWPDGAERVLEDEPGGRILRLDHPESTS
jgi:hypothetical protein